MRSAGVALFASLVAACFSEPPRPGASHTDAATDGAGSGSGSGSGSGAAPQVRLIHHAYWCNNSGSPGMASDRYAISTSGIADGDLVLFIANVDNGTNDTWVLPPGFTPLYRLFYNGGDGQAFAAGYKIVDSATGEGLAYAQLYGPGIASGCAVVMVVAVTGYNAAHPFDTHVMTIGATADNPVVLRGQLTTTVANDRIVLAGGADWLSGYGSAATSGNTSFEAPAGFDLVDGIADSGGVGFQWTSQLIATRVAASPGDTGAEDAHMLSTPPIPGTPWTVELAIEPAP